MRIRNLHTSEQGFTLVELLVYVMLFGLVLSIASTLLINSVKTSKTVSSVTEASTAGQLVAQSVVKGIRNASDFKLTNSAGNDQFLVARTALGGATLDWACAAWYYSAAGDGSIRYKFSGTAIAAPATAADLASWTLLDEGIIPNIAEGTPPVPVHVFSSSGEKLTISFSGRAGDNPPVEITSSVVGRAGASGSLACF